MLSARHLDGLRTHKDEDGWKVSYLKWRRGSKKETDIVWLYPPEITGKKIDAIKSVCFSPRYLISPLRGKVLLAVDYNQMEVRCLRVVFLLHVLEYLIG